MKRPMTYRVEGRGTLVVEQIQIVCQKQCYGRIIKDRKILPQVSKFILKPFLCHTLHLLKPVLGMFI